MHAVFALLAALEHRKRTGEGQLVEIPLVEVALNLAAEQVIEYSAFGEVLARDENRSPAAAPQGVYRCAEGGELAISIATDEQWKALCELMGDAELAADAELADRAGRRANHDRIDAKLDAWLLERALDPTVELLLDVGVPASPVINGHYLMPNPQLEHRQFFQTLKHPVTGDTRYPGFPMNFSILGNQLHSAPPPTLGQNNDEILRGELGLSEEEVEALREKKIIGTRPTFM
jgi:crotonobetainyl-CoA:carnitine CoA-transferase CaiB-like acyl-CoA transferase